MRNDMIIVDDRELEDVNGGWLAAIAVAVLVVGAIAAGYYVAKKLDEANGCGCGCNGNGCC